MVISIHQPNFIPWYPFFQKIQQSDIFVVLENCQFEKNNFQNRFNIGDTWYTMSVNKGLVPIVDKRYVNTIKDWNKIKVNLSPYKHILNEFDKCITNNLSETNYNLIVKICQMLNIKTKIVKDYPTELKSTERLIDICKHYGGTSYLSGLGAKKYLEPSMFSDNGLSLEFQDELKLEKKPVIIKLSELYLENESSINNRN